MGKPRGCLMDIEQQVFGEAAEEAALPAEFTTMGAEDIQRRCGATGTT